MSLYCSFPDCDRHAFINGLCYTHDKEKKKEAKDKLKVKKIYKIPAKSKKQKAKDKELHKVYNEMDNRETQYCTGCGTTETLTHSHLLPRSLFKKHEASPDNIVFHCLKCHSVWESLLSCNLMDYQINMKKMQQLEPQYVKALAARQHAYFIGEPLKLKIIEPFLD